MNNIKNVIKNREKRPIAVVQFGEGNFLRAFVDYFIDLANERGFFNGDVAIVKPNAGTLNAAFNEQDCLYTLQLRGLVNGKETVETRVITSVAEAISPSQEYQRYCQLAQLDSLRFVISNTTEAGIVYNGEDLNNDDYSGTYPAKLTRFLKKRFDYFHGNKEKGLIILPVELIDDNGNALKKCIHSYIDCWHLEKEFAQWIDEACVFASTLVDRIVPGYPKDEKESICAQLGYDDNLLCTAEPFGLWVIEAPKQVAEEFPLDKALAGKESMQILFTDNQKPYKQRKVRILNGAHTSFVLASYRAGHDYVKESMDDPLIHDFMNETIYEEIIPTLTLPEDELKEFAKAVTDRFNNPFIKHALLSISLNSVSKWKARCLPSLKGYVEKYGKLPKNLCFSIAALLDFYQGSEIKDGALCGQRNGQPYAIKDDPAVLEFFKENSAKEADVLVEKYLANVSFHGEDLTQIAGLSQQVAIDLNNIRKLGMAKAMENLK